MSTHSPNDSATFSVSSSEAQRVCLESALGWLKAADAILGYGGDPGRASVLYALAMVEIGKSVSMLRSAMLGNYPPNPRDNHLYLLDARKLIDDDEFSVVRADQTLESAIEDLLRRLEHLVVQVRKGVEWRPPAAVDVRRLEENICKIQDRLSVALSLGLSLVLQRPIDEFLSEPTDPVSQIRDVDAAYRLQVERLRKRDHRGKRGPAAQEFTPRGLEQVYLLSRLWLPIIKGFSRLYRGSLPYERRLAAARELLPDLQRTSAGLPSLSSEEQKVLVTTIARPRNRPSDILNIVIAKRLKITESGARIATRLLSEARRRRSHSPH